MEPDVRPRSEAHDDPAMPFRLAAPGAALGGNLLSRYLRLLTIEAGHRGSFGVEDLPVFR